MYLQSITAQTTLLPIGYDALAGILTGPKTNLSEETSVPPPSLVANSLDLHRTITLSGQTSPEAIRSNHSMMALLSAIDSHSFPSETAGRSDDTTISPILASKHRTPPTTLPPIALLFKEANIAFGLEETKNSLPTLKPSKTVEKKKILRRNLIAVRRERNLLVDEQKKLLEKCKEIKASIAEKRKQLDLIKEIKMSRESQLNQGADDRRKGSTETGG